MFSRLPSDSSPASQALRDPDVFWMRKALTLARLGLGTTSPNPPVGAVIVRPSSQDQGELLLGEGYHERAGEPHAERRALAAAREQGLGDLLRGATIYVTLEPCSSHGRTPPCTEGILEAGIARVVYGSVDPDERHRGRADALLRAAGVEVRPGVCAEDCDLFLRPWMHAVRQGRPWVVAKVATTLDGRTTRAADRWLSGAEALSYAHQLRAESDAILVGGGTVRADDPALTIRAPLRPVAACKQQPWRIVLTRDPSTLPPGCQLLTDAHADRTLVKGPVENLRTELLEPLWKERGVAQLLLECGGGLLRLFLEQGLIDEWVQVLTPTLGGGPQLALPGSFLPTERRFVRESVEACGKDLILRGRVE